MTLLTNLMLTETALMMLAILVSKRVMQTEAPFSLETMTSEAEVSPLAPARGIFAGSALSAVLWAGIITAVLALAN
jgi:hypothetical protein